MALEKSGGSMRSSKGRFCAWAAASFVTMFAIGASAATRVQTFTPSGLTEPVNQVRVRFSSPMVPVAAADINTDIFSIQCSPEVKGTGRWISQNDWAFDFQTDYPRNALPGATDCRFALRSQVRDLSGQTVTGAREFSFTTDGPNIMQMFPGTFWGGAVDIEEDQIFVLLLDAEATKSSIEQNASFVVQGLASTVGVRVVEDPLTRETILNHLFSHRARPTQPLVLIRGRQNFPSGAAVTLVWGAGIEARNGVVKRLESQREFQVNEALRLVASCQRENANSDCIPMLDLSLSFSSEVPASDIRAIHMLAPNGEKVFATVDDESNMASYATISGPFTPQTQYQLVVPNSIRDLAGRRLANVEAFPMPIRMGGYPPLAKFAANFGVLEWEAKLAANQPAVGLPVTLRNLEADVTARGMKGRFNGSSASYKIRDFATIVQWLKRLDNRSDYGDERGQSIFASRPRHEVTRLTMPTLPASGNYFEVIAIPLQERGFHVVEVESEILGRSLLENPGAMFVPASALVTNLAAHLKWGRESSLVWVTRLSDAGPVAGSRVTVRDCRGAQVWEGRTDRTGVARIDADLKTLFNARACDNEEGWSRYGRGLFVTAEAGEDFTFTHSSWDDGIDPWRFGVSHSDPRYSNGESVAHTILARDLLRAGEIVHMKHILRKQTSAGFNMMNSRDLPNTVTIRHEGSDFEQSTPVAFDPRLGIGEGQWTIPATAPLGSYSITLSKAGANNSFQSGHFQVQEFKVPTMRGQIVLPSEDLVAPTVVNAQVFVSYMNGGPASNANVLVRHHLRSSSEVRFPEFDGYVFGNGSVAESTARSQGEQTPAGTDVMSQRVRLDAAGSAQVQLGSLATRDVPQNLLVELEYRDASGEARTTSNTVKVWNADRLIGVKTPGYEAGARATRPIEIQLAALDLKGRPVRGVTVVPQLLQTKHFSHRTRLVGGFYSTEYVQETKAVPTSFDCKTGVTDAQGLITCRFTVQDSGQYTVVARGADSTGRVIAANSSMWVSGRGRVDFEVGNHDRIDLIPAKRNYMPGEKAKFQVRMPFASATALVTVEREGVLRHFTTVLGGTEPTIEIPVEGQYAPNVFVSVAVVRGRIANQAPTAMVDLGKPAFKMGLTEIKVNWQAHSLDVAVQPNKEVFKPRETATVNVRVRRSNGQPLGTGSEVALAVVDEGLLQMKENTSWELLRAMMNERSLEVLTSTAQLQVIGKRHFGAKAMPHGGGGGQQQTRELFDTLVFWRGRVTLNERGEGRVTFPMVDSLTQYRVVAIANSGTGLFGTGQTKISTNQDLIVEPSIAALVRQGDKTGADLTLRNTTSAATRVKVSGRVTFTMADGSEQTVSLADREEALAASQSREITMGQIMAPIGAVRANYALQLRDARGNVVDSIVRTQEVRTAVPASTQMAVLSRVDRNLRPIEVRQAEGATPGVGGVEVSLSNSLLSGLESVREFFANSPFKSLERRFSEAVAAGNFQGDAWNKVKEDLVAQLDGNGLVKHYPTSNRGSDTLTAYMLSATREAGASLGAEVEGRMVAGLTNFVHGRIRGPAGDYLSDEESMLYRRLMALEALTRFPGAVEASVLETLGAVRVNELSTAGVLNYLAVLVRLDLSDAVSQGEVQSMVSALKARQTRAGQTLRFSGGPAEKWWTMSSADTAMARMILLAIESAKIGQEWQGEVPNLVLGALAQQRRGSWDMTASNTWGSLALRKFSRAFESEPVSGITHMKLGESAQFVDWARVAGGKAVTQFAWPSGAQEDLDITHRGYGEPWALVRTIAAVPLREPRFSGFQISKSVEPLRQEKSGQWSRGDIAEVTVTIKGQIASTQVALFDPIPAGGRILGSGLGGESALERGPASSGWFGPSYDELSFEGYKAYYDWVPAREFKVVYRVQLNQAGEFNLPPTRIEATYDAAVFGETPNAVWKVDRP